MLPTLDGPTRRMAWLFSGPPSGDPKRDTYLRVHQQTISGVVDLHAPTSPLNCGGNPVCEPCQHLCPKLAGVDPVAIALCGVFEDRESANAANDKVLEFVQASLLDLNLGDPGIIAGVG